MTEKILTTKKQGMAMLLLTILLYVAAVAVLILSVNFGMFFPMVLSIVVLCLGWLVLPGLKVLRPQEALVLTLFGKYVGTIRGEGFYWVNPFCTAVNPAAKTKLNQSSDVDSGSSKGLNALLGGNAAAAAAASAETSGKRVSLKIMTLNNARQKINDCLGNPVEIGIAVTWRVVDTAKAVFEVDNYKEFLSL
ncbi:MAG: SPFH domain-containing protein, partial [Ruminiclostridium sp.]|nr:SPFH domain-containing protein [Ruminiclostridium sp.]